MLTAFDDSAVNVINGPSLPGGGFVRVYNLF